MALVELKPEYTGYLTGKQNGPILVHRQITKLGALDTILCQGKNYPVRQAGSVWITVGAAMMWYVVSMEDLIATCPSYREAKEACLNACDDGRNYPDIKRLKPGLYEYNQSTQYSSHHRANFFIGTKETLLEEGFDQSLFNERLSK